MMQFCLVLRFVIETVMDNPVGHAILQHVFWPGMIYMVLPFCYVLMTTLGPFFAELPFIIRFIMEKCMLLFSILINRRLILDIVYEIATTVVLIAVKVRYGQQDRHDTELYFRLGTKVKDENGVWHTYYRSDMGSGNLQDARNRFFPQALTRGPYSQGDVFWSNDMATRQLHGQIAKTCCFFSILSYQTDVTVRDCMENAGMLPSVSFYTVHTGITEVDLNVFVSSSKQWAVVCFRGTESETLRDWLSSILVTRPADFDTGQPGINATVRSTYYEQAISACDDVRHPLQPQPETGERTTMQLLKSLRRNYGCKIYFTGHSLGGGLCSLMGAYMAAQTPPIVPTAVITFGSPPVAGNTAFISWFSPTIPQKWRFVNGNEFAPMAPPLPFTTREQLLHVPKLIDVQNMSNPIPAVPGYPQMKERLSQLFLQHNLESLILDHNPVSTLRAIDDQIP
jgi:hypothetical protein